MADYIDRGAAIARVKKQMNRELTFGPWARYDRIAMVCYGIVIEALERLPSADVKPVVFCKDCKHRDPEDGKCDNGHTIIWQLARPDEWYCADGERRGNDNG